MPRGRPPEGTSRITIEGTNPSGTPWAVVHWLDGGASTEPSPSDVNAHCEAFYTLWRTAFLDYFSDSATALAASGIYYGSSDDIPGSYASSHVGTGGPSPLPDSCSSLISWLIPVSYRGGKPRTYLPSPPGGAATNTRQFTSIWVGELEAAANSFITAVNGTTWASPFLTQTLGTVSFIEDKAFRDPPVFRAFSSARAQMRICSQRRRLGRELLES